MQIKTKFDIDEPTFIIHENKIIILKIEKIDIRVVIVNTLPALEIIYTATINGISISRPENLVFKNKEALIKSL